MIEPPIGSARRLGNRFPLGFLGMIAIVASFEWFLVAREADFTDGPAADWRLTNRAASREAIDAEILCFGSSLLKFGLVPELIQERTGLRTFNLSLLGGQSPSSYFLLRHTLAAGARPRLIVVDCQDMPSKPGFDEVRGLSLRLALRSWPELLRPRELVELSRSARDLEFFESILVRQLLPSFRARREVRGELGKLIRTGLTNSRVQYLINGRNWKLHLGSIVMPPKPLNRTKITLDQMQLQPCEWELDPITWEYLNKFFCLATESGARVVWVFPPTSPEHEGLRVRVGQHDHSSRVARGFQAAYPGLAVVDARASGYGRPVFFDDSHLSKPGAVSFTSDLAEALAATIRGDEAAASWVDLPKYRERPDLGKIEDTDQTKLAIKAQMRTVR